MHTETLFKALADPTRLRIMRLLGAMELAVGELAQVLGQSQPRVSRHIGILVDAGLAQRHREGSWIFLRSAIGEDCVSETGRSLATLLAHAEQEDAEFGLVCGQDRKNLALIRALRNSHAEAFFTRHADDWDELRKLHSPDDQVEAALQAALLARPIGNLLDIGTGTGRMAELLGEAASAITALDKSPEMLRIARSKLQHLPAGKCDLVQGDFAALPFPDASFDTVILHQVLHFSHEPAAVLAEAARVMRAGGRVAIVDFAAHGREELREKFAHARLGFADDAMEAMLRAAGFAPAEPIALSGGELIVKIWIAPLLRGHETHSQRDTAHA